LGALGGVPEDEVTVGESAGEMNSSYFSYFRDGVPYAEAAGDGLTARSRPQTAKTNLLSQWALIVLVALLCSSLAEAPFRLQSAPPWRF
jgi:hypothetical protein